LARPAFLFVTPAKAGVSGEKGDDRLLPPKIPAFAGMTASSILYRPVGIRGRHRYMRPPTSGREGPMPSILSVSAATKRYKSDFTALDSVDL
jgi:hypothetical protein